VPYVTAKTLSGSVLCKQLKL